MASRLFSDAIGAVPKSKPSQRGQASSGPQGGRKGHGKRRQKEPLTLPAGVSDDLSPSEKLRAKNWELLDLVLGSWIDVDKSSYSVQLDGSRELNSCSVFTTRPSGRTICTTGLVRVCNDQVLWSSNYVLDREHSGAQEIRWIHRHGGKDYTWHRRTSELGKQELRQKVLAERHARPGDVDEVEAREAAYQARLDLKKRIAAQRKAHAQGIPLDALEEEGPTMDCDENTDDMEYESDDDDIDHLHPGGRTFARRPLPVDEIRWAHDTICIRFRKGNLLSETLEDLLRGILAPEDLPPFQVVLHDDVLFAVTGNRRLWVLREFSRLTGQKVMVNVKCYPPAAMQRLWCRRRFTTKNSGAEVDFVDRRSAKSSYPNMQDALRAAGLEEQAASLDELEEPELQEPPGGWWEPGDEKVTDQARSVLASLLSSPEVPPKPAATADSKVGQPFLKADGAAPVQEPKRSTVRPAPVAVVANTATAEGDAKERATPTVPATNGMAVALTPKAPAVPVTATMSGAAATDLASLQRTLLQRLQSSVQFRGGQPMSAQMVIDTALVQKQLQQSAEARYIASCVQALSDFGAWGGAPGSGAVPATGDAWVETSTWVDPSCDGSGAWAAEESYEQWHGGYPDSFAWPAQPPVGAGLVFEDV